MHPSVPITAQILATAVLAALGAAQAQAGTLDRGNLSISGFGTLGVAQSDADDVQFARYNQAVGVKDAPRIGLDSNLGLQAGYRFDDTFSATAQVLTRKNTSPRFTTELTWAFVKMRLSDQASVRVGRIVMPAFTISDYQNVGYANTMMRPPIELYGQEPVESLDGVDAGYQRAFGAVNVTAQGFAGVSSGKVFVATGGGLIAKFRAPSYGFTASAEYGPVTARVAHLRSRVTSLGLEPVNQLVGAVASLGFTQLARDLTLERKDIHFTAVGLNLDWNNVVVQTEYGQRRAQDAIYVPHSASWYAMAGYRVGKVLPYYAHASLRGAGDKLEVPAGLAAIPQLDAAVAALVASPAQSSDLIGVRWDFAPAMALKAQVDRVRPKAHSGVLLNPPPGGRTSGLTVVAAALDFVF